MPVIVNLDVMLARRKVRSKALAEAIGITESNLSLLKSGKVEGVRFSTLAAICRYLDCEPGDILAYEVSDNALRPDGSEYDALARLPKHHYFSKSLPVRGRGARHPNSPLPRGHEQAAGVGKPN